MKWFLTAFLILLCPVFLWAQQSDSLRQDSVRINTMGRTLPGMLRTDSADIVDSLASPIRRDTIRVAAFPAWTIDSSRYIQHPYFRFTRPTRYTISVRRWEGKEAIFYALIGLLIFFAAIRNGFPRYLQDLFKTYFRTTIRQRQIKEQLLQNPLPSLLLNVFFVLSIGLYLALLLQHFDMAMQFQFWFLFLYCVIALVGVYGLKYLTLKLMGWIMQMSDTMSAYIFIVFSTNKIIGILLLPFLVVLSFSAGLTSQVTFNLSFLLVLGLLVYRFFLSFLSIQRQIKLSFLHFLLYLCAFEIAPLLLINKLLFTYLR